MKHRMAAATLSLIGLIVSLYLSLWKLGFMGPMACGEGSCEVVQLSEYAYLLGIPVAYFGVAGYLGLLVVSLIGLQPGFLGDRRITYGLAALSGMGVAFSGYLTFLEAFVINAWCRWCIGSALIIAAIFTVSVLGFRERLPAGEPALSGASGGR